MAERVRYTMTTSSRLSAARSGEKGHHSSVYSVIPGSTIRGALAALWWRNGSSRGGADAFQKLFDHGLAVGQAVPAGAHLRSVSTLVCKYRPETSCHTFAHDVALQAEPATEDPPCSCGGPTNTRPGWRTDYPILATTRSQLDASGIAASGNLFTRDALPARLRFQGQLTLFSEDTDLSWLHEQQIRVGGKRSTMGSALISIAHDPGPGSDLALDQDVVLRLRSPALIVDEFGAASLRVSDLAAELSRAAMEPVEIERAWLRSEQVTGWHMRSALPKPAEWALAAGCTMRLTGLTGDGWRRLSLGVGLRTLEGFGEFEVLAPTGAAMAKDEDASTESVAEPTTAQLMVEAFLAGGHGDRLAAAQAAIRRVAAERRRSYGNPDRVIRQQLGAPWAGALDAESVRLLRTILDDDEPDPNLLNELGTRISQQGRGGQR